MITRDDATVGIECDAPGCNRSHTHPNKSPALGNALDGLLRKVASEGWLVLDSGAKILHLCPKCGAGKNGAQPLMGHIRHDGSVVQRGSMDVTGMLTGVVVSAQQVRAGQHIPAGTAVALQPDGTVAPIQPGEAPLGILTPAQANQLRKARRRDEQNGTPGLCELPEEKRKELAAKLEHGKQAVFKLTIDLREGDDE